MCTCKSFSNEKLVAPELINEDLKTIVSCSRIGQILLASMARIMDSKLKSQIKGTF